MNLWDDCELKTEIAERKKMEKKLMLYQKKLRSLASELSLAEERLRRKIAIDVHDNVSQNLAISKIKLESLTQSIPEPSFTETIDQVRDLITQTIESTRLLTFELSPPVLYELGFESAIEWLLKNTRQRHKINTDLKNDGKPKPLSDNTRVLLFQAVREILVNIVKHAKANNVKVSIQKLNSRIKIKIEDDGVGFDLAQTESYDHTTHGFGLFSIRERLGRISGNIEIKSRPRRGTSVTLTAPLNKNSKRSRK